MRTRILLNGAFRSGTNYAKALMELNYDVRIISRRGGWKHLPVPAVFAPNLEVPVLGVVRDPWAWLVSMWRYVEGPGSRHVLAASDWESFVTSPITVTDGDDDTVPTYRFASPVDYWNAMATTQLSVPGRVHVVRYEDLLAEPDRTCRQLATSLGLASRSEEFVQVTRRTRNMVDRPRARLEDYVTEKEFDPEPVRSRAYLTQYADADCRQVADLLAPDVVARLGYHLHPQSPPAV